MILSYHIGTIALHMLLKVDQKNSGDPSPKQCWQDANLASLVASSYPMATIDPDGFSVWFLQDLSRNTTIRHLKNKSKGV